MTTTHAYFLALGALGLVTALVTFLFALKARRRRRGGKILDVWVRMDRPSEALFTAMQRRLRERLGIKEW